MKTGGTLNFFQKAGVILMVLALSITSCNKYADDFKQLNTKLDALAATVAGVAQLQTDLTGVKASLASLTTAVAGLPTTTSVAALQTGLTTVTTTVNTINTNLNALALAAANNATKADLATLTIAVNKVTTDVIASLTSQIATLKTQLTTDNGTQTATLQGLIGTLQTTVNTLTTNLATHSGTAATAAAVEALKTQLLIADGQLKTILANTSMYNGDVTITTAAELTFYLAKITQLGIINGNLTVSTAAFSATQMIDVNKITSQISAVIGTTGNVTITSTSVATLDFSKLSSVKGNYSVTGVDVTDTALDNVAGNVTLDYDGPYASATLATVGGNLTLTKKNAAAPLVGTTSISFPSVKVTGGVFDGVNGAGVLVYPLASSIELSGGVTSLTAVKATSIKLNSTAYPAGLTIAASTTAASTVDLSAAISNAVSLSVTGFNGSTVNLSKLATSAGSISINTGTSGTVDFSALASAAGGITLTGPATISFPVLVSGALSSNATTVTLAKHEWAIPAFLPNVVTLTLGSVANPVNITWTEMLALKTLSVTGKTVTTIPMPAVLGELWLHHHGVTSVTVGGVLGTASLVHNSALTSLATSGVINTFVLDASTVLTAVTLAHAHYVGGPGSVVQVTNNPVLASLKTSTDYMASLWVQWNPLMTSLDASSYVTKTVSGNPTITIGSNKLSGTYVNATAATVTTPYVETIITSADLVKLKAYVALYTAPVLSLDLDLVKIGTGTATTLAAKMAADAAHTPAFAGVGITTKAELALVQ